MNIGHFLSKKNKLKIAFFKGKRLKPLTANTFKFDISPAHSNIANRILIKNTACIYLRYHTIEVYVYKSVYKLP